MYKIFYGILFLFSTGLYAQNEKIVSWLNANAIVIENANPDTQLAAFANKEPEKFKNARIFGFGEATHHGKEFFDLKAKFFKYLVEHHGVRLFIMEESYQAERGINEWISGGEGDKTKLVNNFGQYLWYTHEVVDLLQWMRDYNQGKSREDQVRFYGVDNQMGYDINNRLRSYVKKHNITVDESLLTAVDSCSAAKLGKIKYKEWGQTMLPRLQQVKQVLQQNKQRLTEADAAGFTDMMRGVDYLEDYTAYISWPANGVRDKVMYENVLQILDVEKPGSKAFIWAHNEHINKENFADTGVESLGSSLKKHFKDGYYAVGFDFGGGRLKGYNYNNKQVVSAEYRLLEQPYKKTHAETLFLAQHDIYFVDIASAGEHQDMANFFSTKLKQLFLGGPGFNPKDTKFFSRKYAATYDGVIFIKNISPSTPYKAAGQ